MYNQFHRLNQKLLNLSSQHVQALAQAQAQVINLFAGMFTPKPVRSVILSFFLYPADDFEQRTCPVVVSSFEALLQLHYQMKDYVQICSNQDVHQQA